MHALSPSSRPADLDVGRREFERWRRSRRRGARIPLALWRTALDLARSHGVSTLKESGDIPAEWRAHLDALLGTRAWYEEFYTFKSSPTLFDEEAERVVKASTEVIGRYFNDRLKSVFFDVAEEPRVLRNSRRAPLYLLCFAVGNEKGALIALKIANHLLKRGAA